MVHVVAEYGKFLMPLARARMIVSAVEGAVGFEAMAKNMTCLSGLSLASLSASEGEYTMADVHAPTSSPALIGAS